MSLLFLQCSGNEWSWSVCQSEEASGLLLVSSWTDRRAWLDFMVESVWCIFPVNQDRVHTVMKSHEKSWNFKMHFPGLEKSWNLGKTYQTLLCRSEGLGREAVQAEQPGFVIGGTGTETIY